MSGPGDDSSYCRCWCCRCSLTLGGRLWYLQVVAGERYERAATENRLRQVAVPAVRGQILDDQGRPLVRNRTALVVSVSRTELLRQRDGGDELLARLADVVDEPLEDLRARTTLCAKDVPKPCWNGSPYEPIPVTETDDTTMALRILERQEEFPASLPSLLRCASSRPRWGPTPRTCSGICPR